MYIAIASDHGGYEAKEIVKEWLVDAGHIFDDMGTNSTDPVDYPIYANYVADRILNGGAEAGILISGTGLGMSMAANRHKGIRAALCNDVFTAALSRLHNDSNVLCIGGRVVGPGLGKEIVMTWLNTHFEGDRHLRRLELLG